MDITCSHRARILARSSSLIWKMIDGQEGGESSEKIKWQKRTSVPIEITEASLTSCSSSSGRMSLNEVVAAATRKPECRVNLGLGVHSEKQ